MRIPELAGVDEGNRDGATVHPDVASTEQGTHRGAVLTWAGRSSTRSGRPS